MGGEIVSCVTCNFTEFFHDLDLALGFGNVAHKKAQVWDANVNFQMSTAFHFHIIQLYVYIATQSPLILCHFSSSFLSLFSSTTEKTSEEPAWSNQSIHSLSHTHTIISHHGKVIPNPSKSVVPD